ncbi:MAG: hypothetical protein K0S39_3374, partial [Paenibacillus sp.]|nr:hypothetical protein [Paenibacillus sp.]
IKAYYNRIFQDPVKIRIGEDFIKMVESDPWTCHNTLHNFEVFESEDNTVHGNIVKNNKVKQTRQQHKVENLIIFQLLSQFALSLRNDFSLSIDYNRILQ